MNIDKKDWILLLLNYSPLDRIHIMKALFLIWHRSGRNIPNYFKFEPYLYGPCSFEVYSILEEMELNRLIVRPPHPRPQWVNYFLTARGKKEAERAKEKASPDTLKVIEKVYNEVSQISFYELLRKVYAEAPDFMDNSIFKGVFNI